MTKLRFASSALPGVVFVLLGACGLLLCAVHPMAADREVVLSFPRLIAAGLLGIGALALLRDTWRGRSPSWHFPLRPLFVISGSVLAFAGLNETAGLLPAVSANVVIAALGFPGARWKEVVIFAIVLSVAIAAIFVGLLNQSMPLIAGF